MQFFLDGRLGDYNNVVAMFARLVSFAETRCSTRPVTLS